MKDPVWSARIQNEKMILSPERTAQNQNNQTNALLTANKVEHNIKQDWSQERPVRDGSETDLSPVYEEKCEMTPSPSKPNVLLTAVQVEHNIKQDRQRERPMKDYSETDLSQVYEEKYKLTPSPSNPKHYFETQPSDKTGAVPYMERSQCLNLNKTVAVISEESGCYESLDEQSYEIKRDDDDTDCLPEATYKQNHDNLDMDTKNENFDQDFLAEVHSTERHDIDLLFSGTVVKQENCVGDLTMQNAYIQVDAQSLTFPLLWNWKQ